MSDGSTGSDGPIPQHLSSSQSTLDSPGAHHHRSSLSSTEYNRNADGKGWDTVAPKESLEKPLDPTGPRLGSSQLKDEPKYPLYSTEWKEGDGGDAGLKTSSGLGHQQNVLAFPTAANLGALAQPITQAFQPSDETPVARSLLEGCTQQGGMFTTVQTPTLSALGDLSINLPRLESPPHEVVQPPLVVVPRPLTSSVTDAQRDAGADFVGPLSKNQPANPFAAPIYETPLAVLASSSNSDSHTDKESVRNTPGGLPCLPTAASLTQRVRDAPVPWHTQSSHQQPELPGAAGRLIHFTPLIQQYDFLKTDIKNIACTSSFTMEDVKTIPVKLRPLRHEVLSRAEPIANVQLAAIKAGRAKASGPKTASEQPTSPPRAVDVADFHDTLVVFDNALLAISFALWGSVAPYNDLVRALLVFCAPDPPPYLNSDKKESDTISNASPLEVKQADAVAEAAVSTPKPFAEKTRVRVSFSSVLRFLNHCGVDILIISRNRKAASSFCAKRRHVHQGDIPLAADITSVTPPPPVARKVNADEPGAPAAPLRRVLIALSYDSKEALWCPLTTSRPIRRVASDRHEYRRTQGRIARRSARREKRKADAEAAAKAKEHAIEAKLIAWQERTAPYRQQQAFEASIPNAEAVVSRAIADTAGNQPHVVTVPESSKSSDVDTTTLKSGNRLPFHAVLYPNLVQTDVGLTLLLRESLHPLFTVVRLRLVMNAPLGCITFLLGLALVIYVSKTTDVCLFDLETRQCIDVAGIDSSGGGTSCLALSSHRYLYGPPLAPGNCLIVTVCCNFVALIQNILIVYFSARYLALGGTRPCFIHVLHTIQLALGAIVCAFAAFAVFLFHRQFHTLSCSSLVAADIVSCAAYLERCSDRYVFAAHGPLTGTNVALVLASVYLGLCVLHWLAAALPVLPNRDMQNLIPTASPDTYAFRPSLFAPDGPTPAELEQLQQAMQPPLQQEMRLYTEAHDRLLTMTTTIGEMMHTSRVTSLKQMKLNEKRRQRRMRPFQKRSQDNKTGDYERKNAGDKQRRYMALGVGDKLGKTYPISRSSSWSSSDSDPKPARRTIVLAPRLLQRVSELASRVQERGLPNEPSSTTGSVVAAFSEKRTKAGFTSSSASQYSRYRARSRASSFYSTTGDPAQRRAAALPLKVTPSVRMRASTDLVASPKSEIVETVKLAPPSGTSLSTQNTSPFPALAPSGEEKWSAEPPRSSSLTPSTHSVHALETNRSTIDKGIDQVIARLRARKAGTSGDD